MTTNNLALYKLLVQLGAPADDAERAAVIDATGLVTKADLQAALADLKSSLIMWTITIMFAMTGLFAFIARWGR